jgi:hypothetical protein
MRRFHFGRILLVPILFSATAPVYPRDSSLLPAFDRDTVLVWKLENQGYSAEFVVRIAEFEPNRFIEWEDRNSQGTIFMPEHDLLTAKRFLSSNLFSAGADTRGKGATTLWLSRLIFGELKEKKKAKCNLDGVPGSLAFAGEGEIEIEVNRKSVILPVIKVSDGRGSERWFLDREDNPLMVKEIVRTFTQLLTSITTDKPNTLRWIKGKKLENPPK